MHNIFTELTDQIDQGGLTDEQRKQENEAKLNELRALSIVADDWDRKHPVTHVLLCVNEVTATFIYFSFFIDNVEVLFCISLSDEAIRKH